MLLDLVSIVGVDGGRGIKAELVAEWDGVSRWLGSGIDE